MEEGSGGRDGTGFPDDLSPTGVGSETVEGWGVAAKSFGGPKTVVTVKRDGRTTRHHLGSSLNKETSETSPRRDGVRKSKKESHTGSESGYFPLK